MGMSASAELFYGLPLGFTDEKGPWDDHDDVEDWLASLYGWTEDDEAIWNFLAHLSIELVYGGQMEYYTEYAIAAKGSVVTAHDSATPVSKVALTEESGWHNTLVNFCERAGLDSANIGWYIMPCYG